MPKLDTIGKLYAFLEKNNLGDVGYDNEGQIVIYTGLSQLLHPQGKLVPFDPNRDIEEVATDE
jgi:hypothetical protein